MSNKLKLRIIEDLTAKYNSNVSDMSKIQRKLKEIEDNDIFSKIIAISALSLFPWSVAVIVTPTLVKLGLISLSIVQPVVGLLPVLLGATACKIMSVRDGKRTGIKKTHTELVEEEIKYRIDRDKIRNTNKVIDTMISDIKQNREFVKIKDINTEDIGIMTTKREVASGFADLKKKSSLVINTIISGLLVTLGGLAVYNIPIMFVGVNNGIELTINALNFLLPCALGVGFAGYQVKKHSDKLMAYRKINSSLIQPVSETVDYEDVKEYENDIEIAIDNIAKNSIETITPKDYVTEYKKYVNEDTEEKELTIDKQKTLGIRYY